MTHRSMPGPDQDLTSPSRRAPRTVLARRLHATSWTTARSAPLDDADRDADHGGQRRLAGQALRVLAVAYRTLGGARTRYRPRPSSTDLTFAGLVGHDRPAAARGRRRPSARAEQRRASATVMITGDHPHDGRGHRPRTRPPDGDGRVLTGAELDGHERGGLRRGWSRRIQVYARVSPEHKLRVVTRLAAAGTRSSAMTGDGVNDAPAAQEGGHRRGHGHHRART
ncbi:MAG: HAD family hydrolase [Desulfobacterales bacterium]|nr:HAD family hydrolase [Desulfobacterales bacterium]